MFRHFAVSVIIVAALCAASAQSQGNSGPADGPGLFEQGMNGIRGNSVNRNDRDTLEFFRRSAELGYAPAQVALGYMYDTGFRVAKEPRRAADWYKKAAQQGDSLAPWLLGRVIYLGAVPPLDVNDAIVWLQRASDANNPFAQHLLGLIKLEKNDYTKAAELFQKASQQGLPQAQYELGKLLLKSPGTIKQDKFEAYVWLLMAGDADYAHYPDLQSLETDLGRARMEEAKTTARQRERESSRTVTAHGCTGWDGEFDRIPSPPPLDVQQFCR
jgi:tetratricopeptide (TPR) repeat protein